MADYFDAVLAEVRNVQTIHDFHLNRLQFAHEAEVAEVRESARHEAVAMGLLADRAVGLLREVLTRDGECRCIGISRAAEREYEAGECPHQRARAFLSEQAGERENGE